MSLLVGTILTNHHLTEKWLALQMKFLKSKTSCEYEHCAFLINPYRDYPTKIIGEAHEVVGSSNQHLTGIKGIIDYFKTTKHSNLLVIDSDAWPCRKNWQHRLLKAMRGKKAALALRYENLETRLHASILYCKGPYVDELDMQIASTPTGDLLGNRERDLCCLMDKADVLPLLRTNRLNVHPVKCGIYHNSIYHHGAGSRQPGKTALRARHYYYNAGIKVAVHDTLTKKLFEKPQQFIKRLMW